MTFTLPGTPLVLEQSGPASGAPPLVDAGSTTLRAAPGADLFLEPAGGGTAPDAARYTTTVAGDFIFGGHVTAEFLAAYDSGVLLGWIDEQNWFKICVELDPHRVPRIVTVVTRDGRSDDANAWEIPESGAFVRIARRGSTAALHASADGQHWDLARYFHPGFRGAKAQVGILAQSPVGTGTTATFREMFFRSETLADVRDGR